MDSSEECPQPWEVWLVDGYNVKPLPHPKYMVIGALVEREDDYGSYKVYLGFYISSLPRKSLLRLPEKRVCQLTLTCDVYPFLDKDSYLNCADPQPYGESQIYERLSVIQDADRPRILKSVEACRILKERDRQDILSALKAAG